MGESFEDGPDRGRILVSGDDTGGRWSLMEYEVAARPAAARNDDSIECHNGLVS